VTSAAIGSGKPLFSGLPGELSLELLETRVFNDSVVLHRYRPIGLSHSTGSA
jgi:hypothetical protein